MTASVPRRSIAMGVTLAVAVAGAVMAATVNVQVGSYYFEDATVDDGKVVASVGDQLRFTIDDGGLDGKPHSVNVDELGIHSGALLKGSTYVTAVLDKPGTYVLYCVFHRTSNDHFTTLVVTGSVSTGTPSTPAPTRTPAPSPPPVPTSTPGPGSTPTSTAAGGSSQGPAATSVPGSTSAPAASAAGASTALASAADGSADPAATASPSAAPGESPSDGGGLLPPGVTGPGELTWLRSVGIALAALVPIVLVALLAARRAALRDPDLP